MRKSKIDSMKLFLIISLSMTILFVLVMLIGKGYGAEWLAMEGNFDFSFTDHFRHIAFASDMKNFYFNTQDATFPPFAYLLYYLLYRINPSDWNVNQWKDCKDYQYNMVVYIMLIVLLVLFFKYIIDRQLKDYSNETRFFFIIAVLLSAPVMAGAIERGNISLLTALLILMALSLKDSEKAWQRELALIFIAMAAGIKLYPAIVGVIYIKEKRWKEAARLVVYGLAVFLVPFVFCGGIAGLIQYLKILFFFEGQGYRSYTNIRNYLLAVSDWFGQYKNAAGFVKYFKIIENLYLIFCVISVFKTKIEWKTALYPAGVMAIYVPYSYRYTAVYLIIPLVIYFMQKKEDQKTIYSILFSLVFSIPVYGLIFGMDANFFIFTPIYILMGYSFVEDWIIIPRQLKKSSCN